MIESARRYQLVNPDSELLLGVANDTYFSAIAGSWDDLKFLARTLMLLWPGTDWEIREVKGDLETEEIGT